MCRADKSFDPFAESTVDGIIAGAVTVKVCQEEIITEVQKNLPSWTTFSFYSH